MSTTFEIVRRIDSLGISQNTFAKVVGLSKTECSDRLSGRNALAEWALPMLRTLDRLEDLVRVKNAPLNWQSTENIVVLLKMRDEARQFHQRLLEEN